MLHALALVKIKNGAAKHFLETFLQVTFINCYFSAEFFYCDRLANMLDKQFPCFHYFFPVVVVGQKFTIDNIQFFFTEHTVEAV